MPHTATCHCGATRLEVDRPPESVTRPTPGTCEIFCASRVSTRFCTWTMRMVFEVMPSVRIGASAGFTLL